MTSCPQSSTLNCMYYKNIEKNVNINMNISMNLNINIHIRIRIRVYIYMGHGQYLVYSSKSSFFEECIIVFQVLGI